MIIDCVILNYNDVETTLKWVDMARAYSVLSHIILVDNCSTDGSYERLQALCSDHIVVLKSDRNGGYGYGNNVGIRYASEVHKADYILIANPDTRISEPCIEALYDIMAANPAAGRSGAHRDKA